MLRKIINIYRNFQKKKSLKVQQQQRQDYLNNGQIPWSVGYLDFRNEKIFQALQNKNNLQTFAKKQIPPQFGYRLDERIVEYSWIFSQLPQEKNKILDAGSTFNYDFIVSQEVLQNKELSILTFAPETPNFNERSISYVYADLREIPYKNEYFDWIISQSTIEHIDMDNSIYGYDIKKNEEIEKKSYEYLNALQEMVRVLKKNGTLLLTFPYGKFENHGFFQQFDTEMIGRMKELFEKNGNIQFDFFKYLPKGWEVANESDCNEAESFNPHTGKGKKDDGAAHSRAICCIKFVKS